MADLAPPTRAVQELHFRDRRPPHEIQWQLEADLMALFSSVDGAPRYSVRATTRHGRQQFGLLLVLQAALPTTNCYTLRVELTDPGPQPAPPDALARTITSWLGLWGRNFAPGDPPADQEGSTTRYAQLVEAARSAESHLTDVPALQQEILRRMRAGAVFRTAHKEGGTTIVFSNDRWSRVDYGESTTTQHFRSEGSFLSFLRTFFATDISRNAAPEAVPDEKAWRLILRLLQQGSPADTVAVRQVSRGVLAWGLLVATSLTLVFAQLRVTLRGRAPIPGLEALFHPSLGVLVVCVIVAAVWLRRHWH